MLRANVLCYELSALEARFVTISEEHHHIIVLQCDLPNRAVTSPLLSSGHAHRGDADVLSSSDGVDLALCHAYGLARIEEGSGIVKPTFLPDMLHVLSAVLSVIAVGEDASVLDGDNACASDVRDRESALEAFVALWSARDVSEMILPSNLTVNAVVSEVVNCFRPGRHRCRRLLQ